MASNENELRDFAAEAAEAMSFGERMDRLYGAEPDEPDEELEAADDDADDEEAEEAEDAADGTDPEALYDAFWESLSDTERDAAENEKVLTRLWDRWLTAEGYTLDDDDSGEPDDDGDAPVRGLDVVAMAYELGSELADEDGNPITVAAYLAWAVDADSQAWARACRLVGWPATTPQPSHGDLRSLGRGVQGAVGAESWKSHLAKLAASGRTFGQ